MVLNATKNLKQDHVLVNRLGKIAKKCSELLYDNSDIPIEDIKIISIDPFIGYILYKNSQDWKIIEDFDDLKTRVSSQMNHSFTIINKKLFKTLVIPGVIGAILGAILLTKLGNANTSLLRVVLAGYTLFLGVKFLINAFREQKRQKKFKNYTLLAGTGGFLDSFGGGGWGPLVTTTLINKGRSPKYVIGSVSLTEFFVTLASAFTFFTLIGVSHWQVILALVIGGIIAAPIAAKLAGRMPRKTAFILLGILVIIWSIRIMVKAF